jgi:hypothetical protein
MGVHVDAAWNHKLAMRIDRRVARKSMADCDDLLAVEQNVGSVRVTGGDDGAAFDQCGHMLLL